MINGVINVNKEMNFTSHDVVAKLRGILKQKKIGHTGTLDPNATGVLPVCLGNATKLCDMLTDKTKTYRTTLLLGQRTDTLDIYGQVLETRNVNVNETEIREAIMSFVGDIMQVPPMYSALKVDGKKLYELARNGIEIERQARPVTIYDIEIESISETGKEAIFTVSCSKGTYIRTLCDDIGEKLGCLGCMKALTRIKTGGFDIENALTLSQIEELVSANELDSHIVKVDEVFAECKSIVVTEEGKKRLLNGNILEKDHFLENIDASEDERIRVYDSESVFYAIYRYNKNEKNYCPEKMFLLQ